MAHNVNSLREQVGDQSKKAVGFGVPMGLAGSEGDRLFRKTRESGSDVTKLILHLISSDRVQDQEQAPHDLVGGMAGGDDNPVMGLARCKVRSGKRFEIRSIVSQVSFLPAYGTRHLLRIAGLEIAGVTSRGGHEAACSEQIRH